MIYLTNTLLLLPIVFSVLLYFWKLFDNRKDILFGELYIFLMILNFCGYLLVHYRIHHSYENISNELFLSSILIFYIFLIPFSLIYFLLQYKNISFLEISSNFKKQLSNFIVKIFPEDFSKRNKIRLFLFITLGLALTLSNRSSFFICENPLFINLYSTYPVIENITYKIHTISFFGIYILMMGLILFYHEISKSKKIYNKVLYIILILPLFFYLILSHSGGSGLIIVYFLIVLLVTTKNNKNIFQVHIIFLIISIFIFLSMKKEIRANMPGNNSCKLGFHISPIDVASASKNFFKEPKLTYNNVTGKFIKINKDEVSPLRFRVANIFERIDFLQMLAQTKLLIDNNNLKYKKGETYLNREINWKRQFGFDLEQLNPDTISSFNMPAIVESYYNFGIYGIFIFAIIAGIMNVLIFKTIRNFNNNFYLQIIFVISFSNMLIHENDFIFAIKNTFYTFLILITSAIIFELILNKSFNNKR